MNIFIGVLAAFIVVILVLGGQAEDDWRQSRSDSVPPPSPELDK